MRIHKYCLITVWHPDVTEIIIKKKTIKLLEKNQLYEIVMGLCVKILSFMFFL